MDKKARRPAGMVAFTTIWIGQLVSVLATNMTGFALTIWAYEKTGQATALALVQVFFITPFLILSPLAGVMVDRYNRKLMMAVSDVGAGVATIILLMLNSAGVLEVWHLYIAAAIQGTFNTFQWPAYSSAISLMVPKEQYVRVNGMMSLVEMGPGVLAPMLAGALLPLIGLTGVLTIDVVTFVFAVAALMVVFIPQPKQTEEGKKAQGNVWKEAVFGFRYIFARPGLLGLQMVFFFANFFAGICFAITAPMILARTGNNELIFGSVQSLGAIGGIVGGVAMSAWGGFKRRVHGVLLGWIVTGIAIAFVGWGTGLVVWAIAFFVSALTGPLINGSNQAIWQAKVAPDLQGRVFSARRLIAWFSNPITPIIGATLADYVFEPAMRSGGSLVGTFGWLVGTGPGAGMALIVIVAGLFAGSVGLLGYLVPAVRNAEDLLPDHHQDAGTAETSNNQSAESLEVSLRRNENETPPNLALTTANPKESVLVNERVNSETSKKRDEWGCTSPLIPFFWVFVLRLTITKSQRIRKARFIDKPGFSDQYLFLNVNRQGEGGTLAVNFYIIQLFYRFGKGFYINS